MSEEKQSPYTDVQREDFFKAFLADKPFEHTESLFNDKYKVVFRTMTVAETVDSFNQLKKDQTAAKITSDAAYMIALVNYRLAISIVSINDEPFQPKITKTSYKAPNDTVSYVSERAKAFEAWPVFKLSAVADAFRVFEIMVIDLTKEIQQPNFWIADA